MINSIEQLNAFRAVAEEESFTRAAEKLFRTQPAVSQAIHSLEEDLGERLFMRRGRKSTLTQAGRILLEHVEEAFDTLERGRLRIDALKDLREGELTITTSDTTAYYILPDVLKEFREQYPGVDVRIHCRPSPVSAEQVVAHEADIGIVTLPIEHHKLASEPLIVREDVAICAPGHELARRRSISFTDLVGYPLLLLDRGSNTRTYIDQRLIEADLTPKITMELGSIEVIKKLVQLEFGVSIVPLIALHNEAEQGTLKAIRIFKKAECRTLGVIYPAKGISSLAAQIFVKMLKKHLLDKGRF
ncbi:LysR family transcriptional regulator [Thermodesulfobacteriota bacterium]